ncbi:hypothetical protein GCM10009551_079830 [Nocardiopsis tropica]|uniref:hypothetical protein n=1 Tax=Tsukamurella strandjordii TaxID=147577 RepID=UPI0031D80CEB
MSTVLIAYDLNSPGQDYKTLIEKIKTYGTWWHHLDSLWIVKTDSTAKTVRDALAPLIDSGDELLVIDVSNNSAAWNGFNQKGSDWLKTHLFE